MRHEESYGCCSSERGYGWPTHTLLTCEKNNRMVFIGDARWSCSHQCRLQKAHSEVQPELPRLRAPARALAGKIRKRGAAGESSQISSPTCRQADQERHRSRVEIACRLRSRLACREAASSRRRATRRQAAGPASNVCRLLAGFCALRCFFALASATFSRRFRQPQVKSGSQLATQAIV